MVVSMAPITNDTTTPNITPNNTNTENNEFHLKPWRGLLVTPNHTAFATKYNTAVAAQNR